MDLDFRAGVDGGETQQLRIAGRSRGFIVFEVLERLDNGEPLVDIEGARPE